MMKSSFPEVFAFVASNELRSREQYRDLDAAIQIDGP